MAVGKQAVQPTDEEQPVMEFYGSALLRNHFLWKCRSMAVKCVLLVVVKDIKTLIVLKTKVDFRKRRFHKMELTIAWQLFKMIVFVKLFNERLLSLYDRQSKFSCHFVLFWSFS